MSGPWPEQWLVEKAEDFNISTIDDLDKSPWVKVLKDSLRVELEGFLNMYKKAINIINDTDGLEPYLEAFNSDYDYLERAYASLNENLNSIYIALNSITFIKLKTVKKNQVSDENAQNTVKSIRDSVKKKIKSLIESTFEFTPQEALDGIIGVYPFMKS
jgi:ATP-dependent helicase/nuclease subunit A